MERKAEVARQPIDDQGSGRAGFCVWLTGPSGAGKSTLTAELVPLIASTGTIVTVLDVVPELAKLPGERTSRGKLIRKAFVSREIVRHGGAAICVTVSSRREIREEARAIVGDEGFVEVYVHAPTRVTAARKAARPKRPALRKRIRRLLKAVAVRLGVAEEGRFEVPAHPDVSIDTTETTPEEGARLVMDRLRQRGLVRDPVGGRDPGQ